jgi:hypothetical protein
LDSNNYNYDEIEKCDMTKQEAIKFIKNYRFSAYDNYLYMVEGRAK